MDTTNTAPRAALTARQIARFRFLRSQGHAARRAFHAAHAMIAEGQWARR